MINKVWKYQFGRTVEMIELPIGSKILSVGLQYEKIVMWAVVDPDTLVMVTRQFHVYNTDEEITVNGVFIGTVQFNNGIVQHIFEIL